MSYGQSANVIVFPRWIHWVYGDFATLMLHLSYYLQHKTMMMSNLSKLSRLQILDCIVVTVGVAAAVWGLLLLLWRLEMPTPSSAAHHTTAAVTV